MKAEITIQIEILEPKVFENTDFDKSHKTCSICGQAKIPFKLGVCVCGNQMGKIQFVNDTEQFAQNHYNSYAEMPKVEKLGIVEMMDN
ncbi:MAG: hypothetical protein OER82_03250 [Nitrosopumilus sp.]|nr:hypothetical protein [Nitrosopumilus sp.]